MLSAAKELEAAIVSVSEKLLLLSNAQRDFLRSYPADVPRPLRRLFGTENACDVIARAFAPFSPNKFHYSLQERCETIRAHAAGLADAEAGLYRDMLSELRSQMPSLEPTESAA